MFCLPSPLQEINHPEFTKKGCSLWVKRDDLIHPFVSGNKLRKLEGWIAHAIEKGYKQIISFGGAYSNHLLALSYAATSYGLKSLGVVRAEERPHNLVLKHCELFGMELHYCSRLQYKDKEQLYSTWQKKYPNALLIPEGGAGELGQKGLQTLIQEPGMNQAHYYILAAGTGTTALGLLKALQAHHTTGQFQIMAISCVKDSSLLKYNANQLQFYMEYAGKGFGKWLAKSEQLAQQIMKRTGILTDPIYTLKAWEGMEALLSTNTIKPQSHIVFIHTGGLSGWWSQSNKAKAR